MREILEVATTIILSLGGAGAIILGLSSWLGKVWANRVMESDRARHASELEELRSSLELRVRAMENDLAIYRDKHLRAHHDKIAIYRLGIDVITALLGDLNRHFSGLASEEEGVTIVARFDRDRLRVYGYLGMLAPQAVMDANDRLTDHLLAVIGGEVQYDWATVRAYGLALLNEIRKDIGFGEAAVEYRGDR